MQNPCRRLDLTSKELPKGIGITEEVKGLPIYEYECTCCPSRFELKRSFSDDSPVSCPQCGGNAQRIFLPVPIIFKGPGFYSTDSRTNHDLPSHEGGSEETKTSSTDKDS